MSIVRTLGLILVAAAAASVVLGAAIALWQGESVLRWIANMLYVAGGLVLAVAVLAGRPTSSRTHLKRRREGGEPTGPRTRAAPIELLGLAAVAGVLIAAAVLLELATLP